MDVRVPSNAGLMSDINEPRFRDSLGAQACEPTQSLTAFGGTEFFKKKRKK